MRNRTFYTAQGNAVCFLQRRNGRAYLLSTFNRQTYMPDRPASRDHRTRKHRRGRTRERNTFGRKRRNAQPLTALGQNTEEKVSVLVYLDAENLENEHVSATTAKSITGVMNLQFASDADLVPMPYGNN